MSVVVDDKTLETDDEGYLENLEDWSPRVAEVMAAVEDNELGEEHWVVLNILRDHYAEYETAPAVRLLTKLVGKQLGKDKANTRFLYQLFPFGPVRQGCRLAGLPKPTGCV